LGCGRAEGYIYLSPGVGTQQMNIIRQDEYPAVEVIYAPPFIVP
jgi:hypothetical protein